MGALKLKVLQVVYILSVWVISFSTFSLEMTNYSDWWNQLSREGKISYLTGVRDGGANAYIVASQAWIPREEYLEKPTSQRIDQVIKQVFLRLDVVDIADVMSNLYQDPANKYIDSVDMVYIARNKLLGEHIEDDLASARKEAVDLYEHLKRNPQLLE